MKNSYINFGAGNPVNGWINLDSSPYFRINPFFHNILSFLRISQRSLSYLDMSYQYYKFDSQKRLPFKTNSCDAIFTSHVLEHLSVEENQNFFKEAKRVLKKGGVVRVIVPNLESKIKLTDYIFSLEKNLLTLPQELKTNKLRAALEAIYGFPSFHKSMFISKNIQKRFSKDWRVKTNLSFLESAISKNKLKLVEQEIRTKDALVFELIKK
jgi:predicted SAM-dependent methyltransferase